MNPPADPRQRDRQARLLSHAAVKYSRQLRRVASYLDKTVRGRRLWIVEIVDTPTHD